MKRNILKYALLMLATVSLTFTSCEDLDEGAKGVIVADGYFSAEATLKAGITGIYSRVHRGTWAIDQLASSTGADDLTSRTGSNKWVVLEGDQFALTGGNSWTTNTWNWYFQAIMGCNAFLENANPTDIDETILKSYRANAHFVRGMLYFRLVTAHGDMPMPLTADVDTNLELVKTPKRDIMTQVISDLEYAIENSVNERDMVPTVADGHSSKTAAKAFLAKTYMQLTGWPYNEADKWAEVKRLTGEIMADGVYSLMDDYMHNFQDPYQINKEIIFAHMCVRGSNNANHARYYGLKWGGWMDAYMEWTYYDNFPAGYRKDICTSSDPEDPNFKTYKHPVVNKYSYGTTKGLPEYEHNWQTSNDIPAMRYAEVLLMYAEACANAGELQNAVDALNLVKRRAYAKGVSTQADVAALPAGFWMDADAEIDVPVTNADEVIAAIVNERAYEFLGETGANRWLDLVRLDMVAEVNAKRDPRDEPLFGDPSDKSLWWTPIPSTETVLNPGLN